MTSKRSLDDNKVQKEKNRSNVDIVGHDSIEEEKEDEMSPAAKKIKEEEEPESLCSESSENGSEAFSPVHSNTYDEGLARLARQVFELMKRSLEADNNKVLELTRKCEALETDNKKVLDLTRRCTELETDNNKLQDLLVAQTKQLNRVLTELAITKTTILVLPDDCLLKIFKYVDDLKMMEEVCPEWKAFVDRSRKNFVRLSSYEIRPGHIYRDKEMNLCMKLISKAQSDYEPKRKEPVMRISYDGEAKPWYEKNWECKPKAITISNYRSEEASIVDTLKLAIRRCPDWWIRDVKELSLNACGLTDDWLWLIKKLSNLEKLRVEMAREKVSMNKRIPVSFSSLIATLGNCIHTVRLGTFYYNSEESSLVQNLIKKSHLSPTGLQIFSVKSEFYAGVRGTRKMCETLPLKYFIELIETAKFHKKVELWCDHNGDNHTEIFDWMMSKNLLAQNAEQLRGFTNVYSFDYRGSHFKVTVENCTRNTS